MLYGDAIYLNIDSIVIDPNFSTNYYIYAFYTSFVPDCPEDPILGPVNRLSRFTMNPSTLQIDVNSEVILLMTPPSPVTLHDGGAMSIGKDNYIYLAIGDGGKPYNGQNLRTLYGKLIRVDLDGNVPLPINQSLYYCKWWERC